MILPLILSMTMSLLPAPPEATNEISSIVPRVWSVLSGGFWKVDLEAETKQGHYRIIETREGWVYSWTRIFIEWIEEHPDAQAYSFGTAVEITEVAKAHCALRPTFLSTKKGFFVRLQGVESENRTKSCVFLVELGNPGVYKLVR